MTITGSFPSDFLSQRDYLQLVNQTFKNVDAASSLVTVHGTVEPSSAVLRAQWDTQIPYSPPVKGGKMNWYNPVTHTIEQVYYPLSNGSDTPAPYKVRPSNIGWQYITDVVVGTPGILDTGAAYTIPATFRHLMITFSARCALAGVSSEILFMRVNNTATATHQWMYGYIVSTSTPNISGAFTAQTGAGVGIIMQDSVTQQSMAGVGHIFIPNYSASVAGFGTRIYNSWEAGFFSNTRPYTKDLIRSTGFIPVTAAVTRIQLLSATTTNLQRGSKMVLWGMK